MPPAARMGADVAGGPLLTPPQTTVFVGGMLWAVIGTPATPHGIGPHAGPTMVKGSGTVYVGGINACRMGDNASCGCPATPGMPTVHAGG
ncbi:MAG: PAAR domain-containing protein [Myxococcales bacterium]|nr:PAAR domain-containing protein [Myxococcales bacterium]